MNEKPEAADESHACVAVAAAAFLWTTVRQLEWDPERDKPEDIALHEKMMAKARELWPWLDATADAEEINKLGGTIRKIRAVLDSEKSF